MNILIFGNGMLGTYLLLYLGKYFNVVVVSRNDLDAEKLSPISINVILKRYNPFLVINTMGLIKQRKSKNSSYITVNSIFPHLLNFACVTQKIRFIHISTDCVFDGNRGRYNEFDKHSETDIYGFSKSCGEGDFMIIRTSIIGEEKTNKLSLVEVIKSNKDKEMHGYANHYWNGVTCLELAKVIKHIIDNNLWWNRTRHIFSPEIVSKYEIIEMINKHYSLNIKIKKINMEKKIDKSLSTIYSQIKVQSLKDQIKEMYEFGKEIFISITDQRD